MLSLPRSVGWRTQQTSKRGKTANCSSFDPRNHLLTHERKTSHVCRLIVYFNRLSSCILPKVKETILEQISTVEVNSMQQVTQLSAVVVMATEGEKDIAVTAQV